MRKWIVTGVSVAALAALPSTLPAQETTSNESVVNTPADPATAPMTTTAPADAAAPAATSAAITLKPDQQSQYDSWTDQQRADYDAWPVEYQNYYWTLTPDQQEGYWALTPDQREQIYKLAPAQREQAWQSVVQQLKGAGATVQTQANPQGPGTPTSGVPAPQDADQAVPPAMPADPGYQGGPYKGALTAPPASATTKDYPVCTKEIQDSCRNPGGV